MKSGAARTSVTSKLARPSVTSPGRLSPSPPSSATGRDLMAIGKSARASGLSAAAAENYAAELLNNMPSPPHSVDCPASSTDDLRIGDRVLVGGNKPGIIAFIGEVHFGSDEWAGIVLDTATGKNDGSVAGRRYFQCEPKRGVFSRLDKLTRISGFSASATNFRSTDSSSNLRLLEKGADGGPAPSKSAGAVPSSSSSRLLHGGGETLTKPEKLTSPRLLDASPRRTSVDSHHSAQNQSAVPSPRDKGSLADITGAENDALVGGLHIGDRVCVSGFKAGTLRFIGMTDFAAGLWAGVELDEPFGKNDGCVAGTRYFHCEPLYGLFTPVHKLAVLTDDLERTQPAAQTVSGREPASAVRQNRSFNPSPVYIGSTPKNKENSVNLLDPQKSEIRRSSSYVDKPDSTPQKMENGNTVAAENDEISRRLKAYVEKLENDKSDLSNQLRDERRRNEDLQFAIEEAAIEKSDLETQCDKETKQRQELQERLSKETQLTERLSKELATAKGRSPGDSTLPVASDETIEEYLDQIEELTHKLSVAENKLKSQPPTSPLNVSGLCEKCRKLASSSGAASTSSQGASGADTTALKSELERLRGEQHSSEKLLLQLKDEMERTQAEKEQSEKQKRQLTSSRDAAVAERDRAVSENGLLQRKLQEADSMLREIMKQTEQMETMHIEQTSELRKRLENMQAETEKLTRAQEQLMPYRQQVEQLAGMVESLSSERESLKRKLSELQSTVDDHHQLESQHAASQAQIHEMKTKFIQMSKDVETEKVKLLEIVESTKKAVQLKEREIDQLRTELQRANSELSQSKATTTQSRDASGQEIQQLQQRIVQLENALSDAKTNVSAQNESTTTRLQSERTAAEEQVKFLNAVIIEIQKKNVELAAASRRQSLIAVNGPVNGHLLNSATSRLFCDICNVFDIHDTEDCPQQEMSASSTDQTSEDPTY